jgi:hypothetical protein
MEKLTGVFSEDLTGTKGALLMLSQRLGREYSRHTLQYHVRQGNLPAYAFVGADLVRMEPGVGARIGVDHIFVKADIMALPLQNKVGRKAKPAKSTQRVL